MDTKATIRRPGKVTYNKKPAETWMAIRADWEAGESGRALAKRHGVSASAVSYRRVLEGWTRRSPLELLTAPAAQPIDALTIAEATLARATEALAQGRGADAMTLIKAGDAVGAFADFVAKLRERHAPAADVAVSGSEA